jgi:chemotaxis protein CheX
VDQDQLKIFVSNINDYFLKVTKSPVTIGVPFLKDESGNLLLDYTGVIGISGKMKGAVYITADGELLTRLVNHITPKEKPTGEDLSSMIGEIANTIAGNAQKTLGPGFHISVPIVLTRDKSGASGSIIIKAPTFVIPLQWMENEAFVAVGLLKNDAGTGSCEQ